MMRPWLKVLPVFVYQFVARRYCGTVSVGNGTTSREWHMAAPDILVKKRRDAQRAKETT